MGAKDNTSDLYREAVRQARDLLRWRSPLRAELWASRLAAASGPEGTAEPLVIRATKDRTREARLLLTALAALSPSAPEPQDEADTTEHPAEKPEGRPETGETTGAGTPTKAEGSVGAEQPTGAEDHAATGGSTRAGGTAGTEGPIGPEDSTGTGGRVDAQGAGGEAWMGLMGRARVEGAWYGMADLHGEQALAILSFVYPNGKEPHLAVVAIDQAHGGFTVDAVIEEPKFLDDLDVRPADPALVAGRILDAFDLTDAVMGAPVADTLPAARAIVLARARAVEHPLRHAPDDTVTSFAGLPDLPGANEAFATLVEFVGDRPSWWSPARVTQFLTSWLPREAILSDAAVSAMPQVLRAWTRHLGDRPEVLQRVEADSRDLPQAMADELRFSLAKRLRLAELRHQGPQD
ncbi:hypothetical protein [Nonomuraea dietziae]|uniref:Uncharacterized protein n=2 Tax=Nonomuraea dietziae TaxID=65515 RepID=A0A7W5YAT4_9ACTN|nr:hypothetical protein [Nonomuraea dietziae]MBB3731238.1 hypothetical protein [Nonomuraea dietziae]